jgi:hypothetical protein
VFMAGLTWPHIIMPTLGRADMCTCMTHSSAASSSCCTQCMQLTGHESMAACSRQLVCYCQCAMLQMIVAGIVMRQAHLNRTQLIN